MIEVLSESFTAYNAIPTFLFCFALFYWGAVIVGALDMGSLDFDVDMGLDADMDTDVDADLDADSDVSTETEVGDISAFAQVLSFFNLGKVPFMIIFTALTFPMWFISLNVNYYLGVNTLLGGLLTLAPVFFVSLFVCKIITTPLVKMFAAMDKKETSKIDLVGRVCTLKYNADDTQNSQAEIKLEGESYLINVKTTDGVLMQKGETALVIEYNEQADTYLIEPYR